MIGFDVGERLKATKGLNHGEAHSLGLLRNRGVLGTGRKRSKKRSAEVDEGEGEDDVEVASDLSDVDDQMDQLLNSDQNEMGPNSDQNETGPNFDLFDNESKDER